MSAPRIIFTGGGSGGHILPAVAVAQEIIEQNPDARILFVTSVRPIDASILAGYQFDHVAMAAPRSPRGVLRWPQFALKMIAVEVGALRIVRRFKPDLVVGTGAYASVPTTLAAKILGKRIILLEPNAAPGRATRMLARFAETTVCARGAAAADLWPWPTVVLGTPVRSEIETASRSEAISHFRLQPRLKTLLILGGSQGSTSVNQIVIEALPRIFNNGLALNIIHQTGLDDFGIVQERYRRLNITATVVAYLKKIGLALAAADVAVSRAGAITIAEMTARNVPSILIPLPHAAEGDQLKNARHLEQSGGAKVVLEDERASETLTRTLHEILNEGGVAKSMALSLDKIAHPRARKETARLIIDCANNTRQES